MAELPEDLLEEVETLTRRARRVPDEAEAATYRRRREELLAEHGFTARVREEEGAATLVCHPAEWVEDGVVRVERVEDTDRAVEVPLEGPGDPEEWEQLAAHNERIAERVRAAHGDVHGDNADAFAEFMNNHYAKPIEDAAPGEVEEFLEEYFVRNAWPSDRQREAVETSVEYALEIARE